MKDSVVIKWLGLFEIIGLKPNIDEVRDTMLILQNLNFGRKMEANSCQNLENKNSHQKNQILPELEK